MDKCKYHPEYDPAKGDPTRSAINKHNTSMPDMLCSYCLQARVKWLGDTFSRIQIWQQRERIVELEGIVASMGEAHAKLADKRLELEGQLVIAIKKAEGTYGLAKMDLENQIVEAGEREAVLQERKDLDVRRIVQQNEQLTRAEKREAVLREALDKAANDALWVVTQAKAALVVK